MKRLLLLLATLLGVGCVDGTPYEPCELVIRVAPAASDSVVVVTDTLRCGR